MRASGSENAEYKEQKRGDGERDQDRDDPAEATREEKEHAGLPYDLANRPARYPVPPF
jgi:hypothetical protein